MSIKIGSDAKFNTRGTIWQPEEKTTQSEKLFVMANLSTAKKLPAPDKDGKQYRNSNWRVAFVGKAATKFKELGLAERDQIEITAGEVETSYSKEKNTNYVNVTVYAFEKVVKDGETAPAAATTLEPTSPLSDGFMNIPDGVDEELPFN